MIWNHFDGAFAQYFLSNLVLLKFTWGNKQHPAMFCLYTSSKISLQTFEFSLKVEAMGLKPGYLLKSFLLYLTRTAGMIVCLQTTVHDFGQGIVLVTTNYYNRNMAHIWKIRIKNFMEQWLIRGSYKLNQFQFSFLIQ